MHGVYFFHYPALDDDPAKRDGGHRSLNIWGESRIFPDDYPRPYVPDPYHDEEGQNGMKKSLNGPFRKISVEMPKGPAGVDAAAYPPNKPNMPTKKCSAITAILSIFIDKTSTAKCAISIGIFMGKI